MPKCLGAKESWVRSVR